MVTLNLTLNTPEELKLTAEYLKGLAELSLSMATTQEHAVEKPKKQTASKPKTEKVEEEPQIQPQVQAQPKAEEKPVIEETTNKESEIKISDLRTLLSKKVDEHRDDIKAKLTELGAKNVTTLDESKYEEFHTFLKDLK
jgi:outer membrane biosynthesis protein TonB